MVLIMKFEKASRKSHYYDEDRIVIGDNYFMVMDGATPLLKTGIKPSEASWFVSFIKSHLAKNQENILEKLDKISLLAYQKFLQLSQNSNPQYFPSAGLAWIEINGDIVDAYTIGDCEIAIKYKNDNVKRIIDYRLPKLDAYALECLKAKAKENNKSIKESLEDIKDILLNNRMLMNKEQGYPVFTISNEPNFQYNHLKIELSKIKEIYIYSDGITQAFDELKIYSSCEDLFSHEVNITELIRQIVNVANSDPELNRYPRFKKNDDISIIKITF